MLEFASVVKRASRGEMAVGMALPGLVGAPVDSRNRAGLLNEVIASEDLDFFVHHGGLADPDAPTGSIRLHNKALLYAVSDTERGAAAMRSVATNTGLIVPHDSIEVGMAEQTMDQAARPAVGKHRSASQIAVIVDLLASAYLADSEPAKEITGELSRQQFKVMSALGAPYDVYSIDDLFHPRFPEYKVYVFLDIFYLSEAEQRRVDARVKRSDQIAVWLWAPGLLTEAGVGAEFGQKTTGQKLRVEPGETSMRVKIVASDDPIVWGFHTGATFGPDLAVAPTVTVVSRQTKRLGANSANKTVFSVQRFDHWTSVICGTIPAPS
ncbi:MAG TPA: hypothetical protein VKT80_02155, partial [Chloroflexota bacterium]|nr:hypothetical protein [Chloroflexota bacterium]